MKNNEEILNKIKRQEEEIADDKWLDNHRLKTIEETKKEILEKIEIYCLKRYGQHAGFSLFQGIKKEIKK